MDALANREVGTQARDHIRGLDGLRAISLLMVLIAHWAPPTYLDNVLEWGRSGLLIFFVISGFLITRILVDLAGKRRDIERIELLKGFYGRRFFRIQPIYYLALAFAIGIGLNDAVREDVIYHIFFVQNLANAMFRSDLGVYGPAFPWWSLAVEEQFYFFWAPIVLFLRPDAWKLSLFGAFSLAIGWRTFAWLSDFTQAHFLVTFGNLDSLAAGSAVAIITSAGRVTPTVKRCFYGLMVVGVAALCVVSLTEMSVGQAEFRSSFVCKVLADLPVYMIASSLIFFLAIGKATSAAKLLESRALVFIGKRSYGAYVYHQVVNYTFYFVVTPHLLEPIFGVKLGFRGSVEVCVFLTVTLLLAALSYKYIEQPIFRLRDRIYPATR
ncbi:acyltransferase 3 family protein [Rhizobium phaseoli]|uniref:Acyltransferase n=1 Tax=Rhizobium phaseoli TaxID=396 RepID=A0A192TGT3_9HYPH|nr:MULTISPECIES: acyltransferase [Rhizobium]MDH6650174.1 peptidoglycan/LPS O-acetylase OafA/YrhL [Rhizobium esperanzae]ANL29801.1 acyltransferase 3 family protein [Rhizobium phaseoli]ANL55099.1 acyltransferase 3 family protein [Rhizobium phaseoli]ANL86710.1 acyltransferase 3 family protein [Rhizobium phaseoli]ANL93219.1 acyltransferase 3 family protein [Rhizobium phaseoli]